MITIKKLKEKLEMFDENLSCYAYEGEVTGLIIQNGNDSSNQGVIYCSEGDYDENHIEPNLVF